MTKKKPELEAAVTTKKTSVTKEERKAAKTDLKKAAKIDKKVKAASAEQNPDTPITRLLLKAGFAHVGTQAVDERTTAHGYNHNDGSAAIFVHDNTSTEIGARWVLKNKDGAQKEGKTPKELTEALHRPALAAHVLSAITLLYKLSKGTFNLSSFAGEQNYTNRVKLLKAVLNTDKVLVKDSGLQALTKAFQAALEVPQAAVAVMAKDFTTKCELLFRQNQKAERTAARVDKETSESAARRMTEPVHDGKPVLPGVKKLSAKAQAAADEQARTTLAEQIAAKRKREEYTPLAVPRPEATISVNVEDVCLLEDPANGIVLMCLEKPNSQGAICIYNNGSRVAAGVVPTEVLSSLRPLVSEDLVRDVNLLLHPITAGVIVTPVAETHLTAVLEHCKEKIVMATETVVKTKKFAPPAGAAKKASAKKDEKKAEPKVARAKHKKAEGGVRGSYAGKKIKVLSKDMSALREGTKRYIGLEIILKSKTTDEAAPALAKAGCDNTWFAFATSNGYVELT